MDTVNVLVSFSARTLVLICGMGQTDRQVGSTCRHTDHAERKEEWIVGPGYLNKLLLLLGLAVLNYGGLK